MASPRPFQCLFSTLPKPIRSHTLSSRQISKRFIASTPKRRRGPPEHLDTTPDDKPTAVERTLERGSESSQKSTAIQSQREKTYTPAELYPPYKASELAALKEKYTPAQFAAIEAGEAAIPPSDIADQAVFRNAPMSLDYIDDFATIRPYIDKPKRAPESNIDPDLRIKTTEELEGDLARWARNLPQDADRVEWMKFMDNHRQYVGKEEAEKHPVEYTSPVLPKMKFEGLPDPDEQRDSGVEEEDTDPALERLMLTTGYDKRQINSFLSKTLVTHRVVNQTRMGKIQSMYYLVVAGNGKGLIGIGEGKSTELEDARKQARFAAIRNMQPVARYEERTIYGDVKGKVGATELELYTRPPGFGLRTQHLIYEVCRCAGITDLAARVTRSRNPMNTVKATVQALMKQRIPDEIARARGRKLVDVRKVYYAGLT
ncbi:28S ribosomal protein S5, mitochondrial [Agyrium rufum]|nr:28S ribosomal protein S5, mitochondrial [Agyrium rufum]